MAAPKHLEKAVTGRGTNQVLTVIAKFTDFHRVKANKHQASIIGAIRFQRDVDKGKNNSQKHSF